MWTEADDLALAIEIAHSAGAALQETRRTYRAADLRGLADAGDAAAEKVINDLLVSRRPSDAILSEERADDGRRLTADRVWIIDPVDGTREYSEGRADWAVHVALWTSGRLALGVVGIPDDDLVLTSDSTHLPERAPGPIRIAVSRTRPPGLVTALTRVLAAEQAPMGSAGVKIAAVVRGQVDAYVHAGGQYQWDSAAPVAVARAAGLHTSRLDGTPLVYNDPDPYLPDLVVCRPEVRDALLDAIRSLSTEESA